MMLAFSSRRRIFWSQEVLPMLVMLASRLGSPIHWPRELWLMLMMPAFQPMSDVYLPQKQRLMLMMLALSSRSRHLLATKRTANAHDAGLEFGSRIFWSQEVLMLLMLASRPGSAIRWPP